jgi:hypothetical protein
VAFEYPVLSRSSAHGLSVYQIDTDGFHFSGLLIDTNFEADGIALGDLIALAQCRYMEENVAATIVRFDEPKALVLVEHLNFAGWHAVPQFLITDPFLPASYAANRADDRDCRGRPFGSRPPAISTALTSSPAIMRASKPSAASPRGRVTHQS